MKLVVALAPQQCCCLHGAGAARHQPLKAITTEVRSRVRNGLPSCTLLSTFDATPFRTGHDREGQADRLAHLEAQSLEAPTLAADNFEGRLPERHDRRRLRDHALTG